MQFVHIAALIPLAVAAVVPLGLVNKHGSVTDFEEAQFVRAEMLSKGVTWISLSNVSLPDARKRQDEPQEAYSFETVG